MLCSIIVAQVAKEDFQYPYFGYEEQAAWEFI